MVNILPETEVREVAVVSLQAKGKEYLYLQISND